jgi:hypothetical protein
MSCIVSTISPSLTSAIRSTRARRMANVRAQSVGHGHRRGRWFDLAGGERPRRVVRVCRLAADDGDFRPQRLRRDGCARKQAASRDWRADNIEIGNLFQKFESRRALPRDDAVIVERMNQHRACLLQ